MLTRNYRFHERTKKFLGRLFAPARGLDEMERMFPELESSAEFKAELKREMLRSDRTHTPLTLLVFDIEGVEREKPRYRDCLEALAEIVCESSRATDRRGWYRDENGIRIALLLHHTGVDNAHRIIQTVRDLFLEAVGAPGSAHNGNGSNGRVHLDLSCEIYAYPAEPEDGKESSRQLWLFDEDRLASSGSGGSHNERHHGVAMTSNVVAIPRVNYLPPANEVLAMELPFWKRAMDVFIASASLILLAPIMILTAALIKLTSCGPILFSQERVGHAGRIFRCWKFRTMTHNCDTKVHERYLHELIDKSRGEEAEEDEAAAMIKLDDPRVTCIGKFLRKSCIDELPQLFNVLKGEMSIVGPRPCLPYEAADYMRWHNRRFDSMPGITGLWQVSGKNRLTFRQMIRCDIQYARRCSPWLDLKIILKTIPAIIDDVRYSMTRKPEGLGEADGIQQA